MIRNVIRTVAIAMIVFPEPTTTVLGMLILSATFMIAKKSSLRKFGDLDNLVKKSLKDPKASGFNCYHSYFDNRRVNERVLQHTLKTSIPQYEAPQRTSSQGSAKRPFGEHRITLEVHHIA